MNTHINFPLAGGQRAVLRIAPNGFASLDRTRSPMEAVRYGVWRGYWPISDALRDRLLALPAVRQAIRSDAAHRRWEEAAAVHGIGPVASAIFTAANA